MLSKKQESLITAWIAAVKNEGFIEDVIPAMKDYYPRKEKDGEHETETDYVRRVRLSLKGIIERLAEPPTNMAFPDLPTNNPRDSKPPQDTLVEYLKTLGVSEDTIQSMKTTHKEAAKK